MIEVLRLGHRRARDARITTHVCLVARAFGANSVVVAEKDETLEKTVRDVANRFGGDFHVRTGVPWKPHVRKWRERGAVVHLSMYGEPFEPVMERVRDRDVLLVVGAEKVPADLYQLADYNVAVGSQPHSEVAAVALALDRLTQASWVRQTFDGDVRIVPNPRGKTLINRTNPPGRRRGPA
ncbi:MAG TPA: tRNA (cytidine(56)-2'-O)-methyltransferase [Candidatus Thermoplasmatota archaeon]|nr:tRNA (cytidine(56)-2'-O)-methyltransferase [Candidatus Thermoplasmatota archaeon]